MSEMTRRHWINSYKDKYYGEDRAHEEYLKSAPNPERSKERMFRMKIASMAKKNPYLAWMAREPGFGLDWKNPNPPKGSMPPRTTFFPDTSDTIKHFRALEKAGYDVPFNYGIPI